MACWTTPYHSSPPATTTQRAREGLFLTERYPLAEAFNVTIGAKGHVELFFTQAGLAYDGEALGGKATLIPLSQAAANPR